MTLLDPKNVSVADLLSLIRDISERLDGISERLDGIESRAGRIEDDTAEITTRLVTMAAAGQEGASSS